MTKIKQILSFIVLAIAILVALGTLATAYAGNINPMDSKIAPLLCMTFPYWIVASLVVIVISFFVKKRYSLIPLMALVICWESILLICPLNLFSSHNNNGSNTFTLLSYNAYNFKGFDKSNTDEDSNATLNYIATTDADIVCLQECEYLSPIHRWNVYKKQVNEIKKQYPYRIIGVEHGQSIFSKYPVKEIFKEGYFSHFVVDMPNGSSIDIIDVHLKSIPLTAKDKQQYNDAISDIVNSTNSKEISSLKNIMKKISYAAQKRALQANKLSQYIHSIENENIIICGDFNDVPGCYAINTIADDDFDDAYTECGFGPMNTYHGNNINFRIDHVLYKGDIEAVSFSRGNVKYSDHYPLFVRFSWDND
ncbi:MAG: endonuclease/exonuclease/phosphatase family protein [Muribaculaceae bacterium]|nr:endonuclease/exonuclease/phosphatase family protein [Muribaculaceae bacterium]